MLKMIRARLEDDRGFTLIELMVVVLIIAILLAIAIPTFLGLRRRAQDRAAQSDLRNGLTAAKAIYTDDESYDNVTEAEAEATEPSIDFTGGFGGGGCAAAENEVCVTNQSDQTIVLTTASESGTNFCLADSTVAVGAVPAGTRRGNVDAATYQACTGGW